MERARSWEARGYEESEASDSDVDPFELSEEERQNYHADCLLSEKQAKELFGRLSLDIRSMHPIEDGFATRKLP